MKRRSQWGLVGKGRGQGRAGQDRNATPKRQICEVEGEVIASAVQRSAEMKK